MSEPTTRKVAKTPADVEQAANDAPAAEDAQAQAPVDAPAKATVEASAKEEKKAPTKAARKKRADPAEAAPAGASSEEKAKRAKKEKVVRDSFTMPKSDYAKIVALKQKCLDAGVSVKKSELLRAGLLLLEAAPAKRLLAAVSSVETIKTGRPAKP